MTAPHLRLVAASKPTSSPDATPQPAVGRGAVAGPHIPPPSAPEWDAYLARIDWPGRRQRFDPADDLWIPAAVVAIVLFVGGLSFWVGGLVS